jgi:hypothetical protein
LRERTKRNLKNGSNDIMTLLYCAIKEFEINKEITFEKYKLKNSLMSIRDDFKSIQNIGRSIKEDIKDCIESISLKRNESDNSSESGTVTIKREPTFVSCGGFYSYIYWLIHAQQDA